MTIAELLNLATKRLKTTSTSPALDAEVLLSHVLDQPKEWLLTNLKKTTSATVEKKFKTLISRRQLGWPVAYISGKKEFFGLEFLVTKDVLVPRPETETLVETALELIKNKYYKNGRSTNSVVYKKTLNILEIGTGSGCVIISLAKALNSDVAKGFSLPQKNGVLKISATKNQYFASDISKEALTVAKKNAEKHGVKITFKQGSLLEPWKDQSFDIIIANLPYGWNEWKNNSSAETAGLKFEPKEALFTKENGLFLIRQLLEQFSTLNPRPFTLFLEFDPRQTKELKKLAKAILPAYEIEIFKDLAKRDRVALLSQKAV